MKFLKTNDIWLSCEKIDGSFRKKTLNFLKRVKCDHFFVECVSNGTSLKILFHFNCEVFGETSEIFQIWKFRRYDEETEYFAKKVAIIF